MTGTPKLIHQYKLTSDKEQVSISDGPKVSIARKVSIPLMHTYLFGNVIYVPDFPSIFYLFKLQQI